MEESNQKRGKRKHKGIPIPLFSSCVSEPSSPLDTNTKKKRKTNTKSVEAPTYNHALLTKTETALCVNRVRRGSTNKWSSDGLLKIDDFHVLCRQVGLVEAPKDGSYQDPDGLSLTERLLYDLIVVASPSLYRFVQNDKNEWCLKMVQFEGNRLAQLSQLLKHAQVDKAKRDATLKIILEHCEQSQEKKGTFQTPDAKKQDDTSLTSKERKKVIQEPFIQETMTLEERVHARAQARRERQVNTLSKQQAGTQDLSPLLRLADAMWSHSKRNTRREAQFSQHSQKVPFSMTVKDAVRLFSASLATKSSSKTSQLHRERATRAEMLEALRDLQRLVPEWIKFSSSNLTKDTTVWLSVTVDMVAVRTKLGAPKSMSHANSKRRPLQSSSFDKTTRVARVSLSPLSIKSPSRSKKQHFRSNADEGMNLEPSDDKNGGRKRIFTEMTASE